jgi:dTDP-4-amino-4,6-dideoxygalactose transaminase
VLKNVDRDGLNKYLAENKIPSMIYYPVPSHRQKMFDAFGGSAYNLPVTDWLTERVISLPIHTELEADQLEHISTHVLNFINS